MTSMALAILIMSMKQSPAAIASSILLTSILMTTPMYKTTASSWMGMVLIITFASGMMTLFMYASSLAANEKQKSPKKAKMMATVTILPPMITQSQKTQHTMKLFSSQSAMMMMATILIITMVALSQNSHNPQQSLSSSF